MGLKRDYPEVLKESEINRYNQLKYKYQVESKEKERMEKEKGIDNFKKISLEAIKKNIEENYLKDQNNLRYNHNNNNNISIFNS